MAKRVFNYKDFSVNLDDIVLFQRQGDKNLTILFRGTTQCYCLYFESAEERDFAYSLMLEEIRK